MEQPTLRQFLPTIKRLPVHKPLTKEDLLTKDFVITTDGKLTMYYAPHNEYIQTQAKIVIIGITPGWRQMKIAFEKFISCLATETNIDSCLFQAKKAAGFAGTMRKNLLHMLDECEIPTLLNIPDSSTLFEQDRHLIHTTSIIKYPVFLNEKNYTGHQPSIDRSSLLRQFAYTVFPEELAQIAAPALIIPLGKTVEQVILKLASECHLSHHHYLTGFPHPSGANGHRVQQFKQNKDQLRNEAHDWAKENIF